MYLKNKMKKILLVLIISSICLSSFSQSINRPVFDTSYYKGMYYDNDIKNKYVVYLFLKFLSNNNDSMLVVVPYKMKKTKSKDINKDIITVNNNIKIMNDTVSNYLINLSKNIDDIEYHQIFNKPWTINGFDNFTYYELQNDKLSFSINIANTKTDSIEVFYFNGNIIKNGKQIDAIIWSEDSTFKKKNINLELYK
jgi:hypothetical protein